MTDKEASQSVIARATAQFQSGQTTTTRTNTNDTNRATTSAGAAQTTSGGGYNKSTSPTLTPSQRAQIQFQEQNTAKETQNQTKELADYGTAGILYGMQQKNYIYKTDPTAYSTNKQETDIQKLATRRGLSVEEVRADMANIEPATMYTSSGGPPGYRFPDSAKTQYDKELSKIKATPPKNNGVGMLERVSATITYPASVDDSVTVYSGQPKSTNKPYFPIGDVRIEGIPKETDVLSKEKQFYDTLKTSGLNLDDQKRYASNYEAYKKSFENASSTDKFNVTVENPAYTDLKEQAQGYQRVEDAIGAIRPDKMAYMLQDPLWTFKETKQPNTTYYSDVKIFGQTVFRADVTNWDKLTLYDRPKSSADIIVEGYGKNIPKSTWSIKTADQAVGDYLDAQTQSAKSTGGREGRIQTAELGVSFVSNLITTPIVAGSMTGKALGKAAWDWGVGFGLASPIAERETYKATGSKELASFAGLIAGAGTIGIGESFSAIKFKSTTPTEKPFTGIREEPNIAKLTGKEYSKYLHEKGDIFLGYGKFEEVPGGKRIAGRYIQGEAHSTGKPSIWIDERLPPTGRKGIQTQETVIRHELEHWRQDTVLRPKGFDMSLRNTPNVESLAKKAGKSTKLFEVKLPAEKPFTGLAKGEKPFTGLAAGEKLTRFNDKEFFGNIRGGESYTGNKLFADSRGQTVGSGGYTGWKYAEMKTTPIKDIPLSSRYYYVNDKAYTLRIPETVEKTGLSKLDKKMMFDDVKPQTKTITKDIDFGPQLEPKTWGYKTEKPVIDFTEYKGDLTYTKLTKGGEKAAARDITALDYNNIREIKQTRSSGKTTKSGDLMLLQKDKQILDTINKQVTIAEKSSMSRLDKKIASLTESKLTKKLSKENARSSMLSGDKANRIDADPNYYYKQAQKTKSVNQQYSSSSTNYPSDYNRQLYDSSSMMDSAYETLRFPTQRPMNTNMLLDLGSASKLQKTQAQTHRLEQQQANKLGQGQIFSLASIQGLMQSQMQGQIQGQTQIQTQKQQQIQQQKQTQKQMQDILEDTRTIQDTVKQDWIDKPPPKPTPDYIPDVIKPYTPPPKPTPDYIPDVIKPYTPPPIVPLWLPGGGSGGSRKHRGSQYPNYDYSMKYHPIFTASQVGRLFFGGKRR